MSGKPCILVIYGLILTLGCVNCKASAGSVLVFEVDTANQFERKESVLRAFWQYGVSLSVKLNPRNVYALRGDFYQLAASALLLGNTAAKGVQFDEQAIVEYAHLLSARKMGEVTEEERCFLDQFTSACCPNFPSPYRKLSGGEAMAEYEEFMKSVESATKDSQNKEIHPAVRNPFANDSNLELPTDRKSQLQFYSERNRVMFRNDHIKNFGASGLITLLESHLTNIAATSEKDSTANESTIVYMLPTHSFISLMGTLHPFFEHCFPSDSSSGKCDFNIDVSANKIELKMLKNNRNFFTQLSVNDRRLEEYTLMSGENWPFFKLKRHFEFLVGERPWIYCQYGLPRKTRRAEQKGKRLNTGLLLLGGIIALLTIAKRIYMSKKEKLKQQ